MRSLRMLAFLGVAVGCGATGRGFEYDDKVAVRTAFIEVVNERYRERQDGVLQAPTIDPNRVRFVFLYDKGVGEVDSEWVELTFARQSATSGTSSGTGSGGARYRPVYRVLAYQPLPGPNLVMDEESRRIEGMLQERLKPPP